MLVQPNPSDGNFSVSIKNPTSGKLNLRVYNSSGMLVNCRCCSNGSINHENQNGVKLTIKLASNQILIKGHAF